MTLCRCRVMACHDRLFVRVGIRTAGHGMPWPYNSSGTNNVNGAPRVFTGG